VTTEKGLLKVSEAAATANVSESTIRGAITAGELECYRIRKTLNARGTLRISREQLKDWLERSREEAPLRPSKPQGAPTRPKVTLKHLSLD